MHDLLTSASLRRLASRVARGHASRAACGFALGLLGALAAGCGGGFGDPPTKTDPNEYGNGTRISSTLGGFYGPATWHDLADPMSLHCTYPLSFDVFTSGATITAVDTFDETGDGAVGTVYIQDTMADPPGYAGMSLYAPSFTPPDLRVAEGDVVDVRGTYEEFAGPTTKFDECQTLPQIAGTVGFRFDGKGSAPKEIAASELGDYETARKYLGMLVKVKDVQIAANGSTDKAGRYNAKFISGPVQASLSNELWDLGGQHPLKADDTLTSVTGIVTYFYTFHVAPRSADDLEP